MFSWLHTIVEVCDGKGKRKQTSETCLLMESSFVCENIVQAIKPTTVEAKLNTTLRVVLSAVTMFVLRDVIYILTRFGSTPTHISNPFPRSITHDGMYWQRVALNNQACINFKFWLSVA